MANKIPDKLRSIAKDMGMNTINFVITSKEGEVFSLGLVDQQGKVVPTGLPLLYAFNGTSVVRLSFDRAFEILSELSDEE